MRFPPMALEIGIGEFAKIDLQAAEQLASETVILAVNLKPPRLMAVRSEGRCWGQWSRKMGSGQYWIVPCRREPL